MTGVICFIAGMFIGAGVTGVAYALMSASSASEGAAERDYLEYLIDKLEDASDESREAT